MQRDSLEVSSFQLRGSIPSDVKLSSPTHPKPSSKYGHLGLYLTFVFFSGSSQLAWTENFVAPANCSQSSTSTTWCLRLTPISAAPGLCVLPHPHLELVHDLAALRRVEVLLRHVALGHVEPNPRNELRVRGPRPPLQPVRSAVGPDLGDRDVARERRLDAREQDPVRGQRRARVEVGWVRERVRV